MAVRNEIDRYHLMADVFDRVPKLSAEAVHAKQALRAKLNEHTEYIAAHGDDMPGVRDWRWPNG
jgi:xylulose-5-phosphate/fructose-6-phosphate phosphoketolase